MNTLPTTALLLFLFENYFMAEPGYAFGAMNRNSNLTGFIGCTTGHTGNGFVWPSLKPAVFMSTHHVLPLTTGPKIFDQTEMISPL